MRYILHRTFDMIFGPPILLLGACGIVIDVWSLIGFALNHDPNVIAIITFPIGTLAGAPLFWFGGRLIFGWRSPLSVRRVNAAPRCVKDSNSRTT